MASKRGRAPAGVLVSQVVGAGSWCSARRSPARRRRGRAARSGRQVAAGVVLRRFPRRTPAGGRSTAVGMLVLTARRASSSSAALGPRSRREGRSPSSASVGRSASTAREASQPRAQWPGWVPDSTRHWLARRRSARRGAVGVAFSSASSSSPHPAQRRRRSSGARRPSCVWMVSPARSIGRLGNGTARQRAVAGAVRQCGKAAAGGRGRASARRRRVAWQSDGLRSCVLARLHAMGLNRGRRRRHRWRRLRARARASSRLCGCPIPWDPTGPFHATAPGDVARVTSVRHAPSTWQVLASVRATWRGDVFTARRSRERACNALPKQWCRSSSCAVSHRRYSSWPRRRLDHRKSTFRGSPSCDLVESWWPTPDMAW